MILFHFLAKNNNEKKIEKLKMTLVLEIWQQQWFDKDEQKYMKIWRYENFLKKPRQLLTHQIVVLEKLLKEKRKHWTLFLKEHSAQGRAVLTVFRGGKKFSDRIRASC